MRFVRFVLNRLKSKRRAVLPSSCGKFVWPPKFHTCCRICPSPATWTLNMFAGYSFTFGPSLQLPPGIQFGPGAGGTLTVTTVTRPEQGRYRMSVNMNVQNLTNRTNLMGYSGVVTSQFFGKPTMAQGARRIHVNMNLQF